MERVKIKYINNDPTLGIAYDWALITKEYRKLGIPKEYDITEIMPLSDASIKWYILNSERSVGKTTNVLLIGMVMNKLYGTVTQLIRHSIQKASYYDNLFNTIVAYKNGQYIKRLTDGEYNTVKYFWKGFYYAVADEKGKTLKAETPFCVSLESCECYNLCSCYEAPLGDWIVLDECFNETNTADEFYHFIHLHKTIVRDRMSDTIVVLGNTNDRNNIWYRQLTIQNEVRKLKKGMAKIVKTSMDMPIFITFMENRMPVKRQIFNRAHYGFDNPELNAITGNGDWKMKMYPLTCLLKKKDPDSFKILTRGIFFSYHDDLYLECGFASTAVGLYLEVHPSTEATARQGELVYTLDFPIRENEMTFGVDPLSKKIMKFLVVKRAVFNDNETGDLFEKFLFEATGKRGFV